MEFGNDNLHEEQTKSWSDIAVDLLEGLLMRLDVFSRLACAGISQHWSGRIGKLMATNAGLLRTSPNIPPSLFGAKEMRSQTKDYTFYDLYSEKCYSVQVPELTGQNRWFGGGEGWVVAAPFKGSVGRKYTLVNPLTNEQIDLPSKITLPGGCTQLACNFKRIVICRSPEHAEGFLLVGLPYLQAENVACLTPADETWKFLREHSTKRSSMEQCEDVVLHDGKLFVLTSEANLYMYQLAEYPVVEPTLLAPGNEQKSTKNWKQRYLLESGGSLMMITRENGYNSKIKHPTRVYASKCEPLNGPVAWERVSNIGALVIFLGNNSNSTAITADQLSGVEANNVYFIEDFSIWDNRDGSSSNVGQYDLSKRLYRAFAYPRLKYPIWLKPSLGRSNGA